MKSLTRNIDELTAQLQTKYYGRVCRWFDAVDSTNSLAVTWAKEGAGPGSLVVADFQRRGRGRFSRSWTADPGQNLTFSLVIDTEGTQRHLEMLPATLAVAIAETLAPITEPHRPLIKWPNDVLLAGRKICGILIESSLPSDDRLHRGYVVAGIGINVNQEKFPAEIADRATSLFQVLGRPTDRIALLSDVLQAAEVTVDRLASGETGSIVNRYEARMTGLGKIAVFRYVDRQRANEGTVLGIDQAGGLKVRTRDGVVVLRAGEVTFKETGNADSPIVEGTDASVPPSSS